MALIVPICGDQDGSEGPIIINCPDYIPFESNGIVQVPGSGPVNVVFDFVYGESAFNNELGVITVDDANGSIDGKHPGDPDYLGLAFARATVIFDKGSNAYSPDVPLTYNGGAYLMFFIIQNDTLSNLLAINPSNSITKSPVAFFSLTSLNPDNATNHVLMFSNQQTGLLQLAFEDFKYGGDNDFNDDVINILIPGLIPTRGFKFF